MANKSDFDKIDTNKDGFISEEEYANASKSAGVEKHKLNWFSKNSEIEILFWLIFVKDPIIQIM